MIRIACITLILFFISGLARAEEQELCDQFNLIHKPAEGVAYQPGVDVRGNPVPPADLNAPPADNFDKISVPITIDLAERLGQNLPVGAKLETNLGTIDVYRDGRVIYNGRDLSEAVKAACGQPQDAAAAKGQADQNGIIWGEGH